MGAALRLACRQQADLAVALMVSAARHLEPLLVQRRCSSMPGQPRGCMPQPPAVLAVAALLQPLPSYSDQPQ
jgi:hypothetical protein